MNQEYWVLAFYRFTPVADPHQEVAEHKSFFKEKDITSRIYISEEGINGQMSAHHSVAPKYIEWLRQRPPFADIEVKVDYWHEQVFPRTTVKYRAQLVGNDEQVDMTLTGTHLSPQKWKEKLESGSCLLVDVRNDYESEVGHFDGAELPPCKTFRDFSNYADQLVKRAGDTPIMMYCTGGIRCELYSALLKQKGAQVIYQLNGGIINYGHQIGNDHWKGKLFVFDDRMAVPISDEPAAPISQCHYCSTAVDDIYNCANMDCNALFIACRPCLEQLGGCCSCDCQQAPRVRPYQQQNAHKPFRRAHTITRS